MADSDTEKTVSIVGKGKGWQFAPESGNVWGITQLICMRPVSRVIDMNDYRLWGDEEARLAEKARAIAKERGIEYIDLDSYPLRQVMETLDVDYFSNTVDYAIALAIYEGYRDIHLWGVNMELHGEYAYQKPGVDFWCGYALGAGARVTIHGVWSRIMRTRDSLLYGYGVPQTIRGRQGCDGGMRCLNLRSN